MYLALHSILKSMEFAPAEGAGTQVHGLTLLSVCVSISLATVTVRPQASFTVL